MAKYLDEKGLKKFASVVNDQIDEAHDHILSTKGEKNGIASLDNNGFVPLGLLGNLDTTFFEVVTELPSTNIKKHIYLIKNLKDGEQDNYTEYIYTGDVSATYDANKWEKLGDFVPTFDLNEYTKKTDAIKDISITYPARKSNCKLQITFASGSTTTVELPTAVANSVVGDVGVAGCNGLMSSQDKKKLDNIDTVALTLSISEANTAADNTNAAISACLTATAGAEKVNATITDDNIINITDRSGVVKSTDISGVVTSLSDIARVKQSLGNYAEMDDITLSPMLTNKAINKDGVLINKSGWAIAEFTAELGNEYLFKPGVTDKDVCVFAEYIDKVETRAIDYQTTFDEQGRVATATATYLGKTYTYTYDYSGVLTIITDQNGKTASLLPMVYTTKVGSYSVLTKLNDDAELPEDGYCRFVSNFQSASSIKVVVSYKVGVADLTMKVLRDGMTASMCTQLSKINKKVDDIADWQVSKNSLLVVAIKDGATIYIDGEEIEIPAKKPYTISGFKKFSFGKNKIYINRMDVNFDANCVGEHDYYFESCKNLTSLNISRFDTSKITSMRCMFRNTRLSKLDVSHLNTSNAVDMSEMFMTLYGFYNNSLTYLDVSAWDTSKVTDIHNMFAACYSIVNLDVSAWDTSSIVNMNGAFNGCTSLTYLDVSAWDTSKVTDMAGIFYNCNKITSLTFGEGFGKMTDTVSTLDLSWLSSWKNDTVKSLLNLYDRKANGMGVITIKLHANAKSALGEDGIATLTSKGYTIA